jgi:UDP-N-acetyl-D-glucosamine/UDP-N-acetyl-D-galactosamine dehydrogenase
MPANAAQEKIAVIGLGYVGLPLALALAKKFPEVYGFDINEKRIADLKAANDVTGETDAAELKNTKLRITSSLQDIAPCTFYIVSVPTPIDDRRQPDLTPLQKSSETVGSLLKIGDVVVYESTVYPGVTEEYCGPILEKVSGLKQSKDFKLGYSPERINPGDKEHTLERVVKVVSGEDAATLERVSNVYGAVVTAGVHKAPTIKVAEAAKVIENIQRDLNIALMNELSIIFDRLDIRTKDVLQAAGTKWNFMPFTPGLVGGHCIGVDPYYLTARAEQAGYHPQVILSGRRINDGMGAFVAQKTVRLLAQAGTTATNAKVGIMGLTFKENVSDLRNSKVPDILKELEGFGIKAIIHDAHGDPEEAHEEYGIELTTNLESFSELDALILAVPHKEYLSQGTEKIATRVKPNGVIIDVKSVLDNSKTGKRLYWGL